VKFFSFLQHVSNQKVNQKLDTLKEEFEVMKDEVDEDKISMIKQINSVKVIKSKVQKSFKKVSSNRLKFRLLKFMKGLCSRQKQLQDYQEI
jgi:hypothetical protein